MSPNAQDEAIADFLGILKDEDCKRFGITPGCIVQWPYFDINRRARMSLPNYRGDLNAMHEAENALDADDFARYAVNLIAICSNSVWAYHATSGQRAEAFLKTICKWDDSK